MASLVALAVAATGTDTATAPTPGPVVAVSVLPQAYFVDRLAAGRVRTLVMIPPGASPATYAPDFSQLRALSEAALYVKVGHPGFPFERAWLDDIAETNRDLRILDLSAGVATDPGDPHIWLTPEHARALCASLEAALAGLLPEARAELAANRRRLEREIGAVDRELRERLDPVRGGRFLVLHAAWGYLARAYGLEQMAIQEGGREPGARQLAERIAEARRHRVKVVFVQPQLDRAPAEVIAAEIGARVEALDPLAYDWPRNLRDVGLELEAALLP